MKSESQLAVGDLVASFSAKDLDGRTVMINYGSTNVPTLLYIFAPDCEWCAKNVSNVQYLATEARGNCRIIGLSLSSDNLRDYAVRNNLNFPIYAELQFAVTRQYKMGGTPQTILVSPEGRVLRNWPGAYVGARQQEVEDYFHIQLPGVTEQ